MDTGVGKTVQSFLTYRDAFGLARGAADAADPEAEAAAEGRVEQVGEGALLVHGRVQARRVGGVGQQRRAVRQPLQRPVRQRHRVQAVHLRELPFTHSQIQ